MINTIQLPSQIAEVLASERSPEERFSDLMGAIAEFLQCDRCFLYLRQPQTRLGRVPFCWVRSSDVPTVYDEEWKPEPPSLPDEDPMFAAALRTEPSLFIEDVETASSDQLNRQFEQENFGHRALIHAHLCQDQQLWGVLQPCLMARSRRWTETERQIINQIVQHITPIAVEYVNSYTIEKSKDHSQE
ncbi:MAG: GAF domain-containing protein [Myxacorys californica WJT36-NPBG1]|jgi:GAF domain-containing protein|nr:GAF domain-containing protein [Myxacorys californica WJT36-NPBG1]